MRHSSIHVMHVPVPISLTEPRESREAALFLSLLRLSLISVALFIKVVVYFCIEVKKEDNAVEGKLLSFEITDFSRVTPMHTT